MTSPKRILQLASQTLVQRFPNGLELNSRELDHFAGYFGSNFNDAKFLDALDDAKLKKILRAAGVVLDGKVYPAYPLEIQNVVLAPETTRILSVAITKFFPDGLNVESTDELKRFEGAVEVLRGKMTRELNSLRDDFLKLAKQAKSLINAKYVVLNRMIVKLIAPFNGVVHPVLRSTQNLVEQIAEDLFDSGIKIVYYSAFFERNKELLVEKKLVSAEFFTFWLKKINSNLVRKNFYFERTPDDAPDEEKILEEIERVLNAEGTDGDEDEIIQTLVEKTFVPEDKIREVVALYPQLNWILTGEEEFDDEKLKEETFYPSIKRREEEETSDRDSEEKIEEEGQEDVEEIEDDEEDEIGEEEQEEPNAPSKSLDVNSALIRTLLEHYPNGFPAESKIERRRLRNLTRDFFEEIDEYNDYRIQMILDQVGRSFEGKIYILPEEADDAIRREINDAFDSGANLVYFDPLYQKLRLELPDFFSVELLKKRVKDLFKGKYSFTPDFCEKRRFEGFGANATTNAAEEAKVAKEIKRVWGDGAVVASVDLNERLPLIPPEKIKSALLHCKADFVKNDKDSYARLDQIVINDEERKLAQEYVAREIQTCDFASVDALPLGNMPLRNEEIDAACLKRALFRDCLEGKYQIRGHIITLNGVGFSAKDLIVKMCRKEERVSLEQLQNWERELTDGLNYSLCLEAGYEALTRTSKDEFVKDRFINFNVDEIDDKIDERLGDQEYLPLKAFVSFATYPNPGVAWSQYLLESFCLKHSKRFTLCYGSINSANIGAVVRKNCNKDYDAILEDAVANSQVPLTKDSALSFLQMNGYIGQKRYSKIEELLRKAKKTRQDKENR